MELESTPNPCCIAAPLVARGAALPLPSVGDAEGLRLPEALPPVIDAHVHLFPDRVFDALWRFFAQHVWPVRYQLYARQVLDFLFSRGVEQVVALHYAHKPGMARALNEFMASLCVDEPRLVGLATVLPGEPNARAILDEAFASGLRGVKLHCHVQCFSPDAPELHDVYAACVAAGVPLVMHAGREPTTPAYKCDPYQLCAVERVERVLRDWPTLKLCVPHFGADEFDGYARLLERFDSLWLDTTMMSTGYFPFEVPRRLYDVRPERILYGTDFPNLPYAWDREVRHLTRLGLSDERLAQLLGGNASNLYGLRSIRPGY